MTRVVVHNHVRGRRARDADSFKFSVRQRVKVSYSNGDVRPGIVGERREVDGMNVYRILFEDRRPEAWIREDRLS